MPTDGQRAVGTYLFGETRLSSDAVALIVDHDGKPLVQSANGPAEQFAIAPALGKTAQLSGEHNWIYSASPLVEGQLFLVYAEPELPVFAATRNQLYLSMAVPLLAVVLGCLALWIGVRRLVLRWLRELTGVAEALRQGTYPDHRERFDKAPRELAQLSDDLHDMAGAIELRDRSLTEAADRNLALAREVNHRVKNNLQIVISLISLQKANVSDPAAQSALEQTGTRIAGIGLIHQLLYDESPGELGQVEIVKLIGGLCRLLTGESDEDRIALECEGGEGSLPIDQAVPLTLFIIEAVANAYRHGYPGKRTGIIAVELSRDESRGFLCVTDDGVGYDRTRAGMATGLALMQAYVVQLRGELALDTNPTQGVKLDLRFPIAEEAI